MKKSSLIIAILVTLSVLFTFAYAQEDSGGDEMIELLIEKTREREVLFDNVEVNYSYEYFGSPNWSARLLRGYWAKSGQRRLIEIAPEDRSKNQDRDDDQKRVSTPEHKRALFGKGGNRPLGNIEKTFPGLPIPTRYMAPEQFGVTALSLSGTLVGFLECKNPYWQGEGEDPTKYTIRVVGEESIDGRDLIIVEQTKAFESREALYAVRLYFDKELNYSCVMAEEGKIVEGKFQAGRRHKMDGFQEIKPGLFVPFSCSWGRVSDTGQWSAESIYKIEDIEFRSDFDDEFFELEFPPGIEIIDEITGRTTPAVETPSVDIDEIISALDKDVKKPNEPSPALAPSPDEITVTDPKDSSLPTVADTSEKKSQKPLHTGIIAVVAILLIAAIIFFIRRAKR